MRTKTKLIVIPIITIFIISACRDNEITAPADIPVAPRLLRAVAVGDTAIMLAWEDVSPNEDGVKIFESVHPDSEFVLVETIDAQDADSAFLSNKDGDTPYRYKVQAFNLLGGSVFSQEARVLDPEQIDYFNSHSRSIILCLDISPDGRYIATGKETYEPNARNTLECWEIASGQLKLNHAGDASVNTVSFSPDSRYVAAGEHSPAKIRIWDIETRLPTDSIGLQITNGLVEFAYNPVDDYLAAGFYNIDIPLDQPTSGKIAVYSTTNWELFRLIDEAHPNRISALSFSPDGSRLASASWESRIRLWSGSGTVVINTLATVEGRITDLCFNQDNSLLASSSRDSLIRIWDVEDGSLLGFMKEDYWNLLSVVFSPDGFYLVSAALDVKPKIWDYRRWLKVYEIEGLSIVGRHRYLAFTPDGEKLLVADDEGIYVFKMYR